MEVWELPEKRAKKQPQGPANTDISQQLEGVGSHFGQLGEDVGKWGDSLGTLEERRQELENNYAYMQQQARRLGGVPAQTGAPPSTAMMVQAATQIGMLVIQSLWIRVFSTELSAVEMAQIAILIQGVLALAVSAYLNKKN